MSLNRLRSVSKKRISISDKTVKCRKECSQLSSNNCPPNSSKKCSNKHIDCIKKECDKVDKQLWRLNWTYNRLMAEVRYHIIKVAVKHGKVDKTLYIKVQDMFLDNAETEFKDIFMDVKQKTAKKQLAEKLKLAENAIMYFKKMENKSK